MEKTKLKLGFYHEGERSEIQIPIPEVLEKLGISKKDLAEVALVVPAKNDEASLTATYSMSGYYPDYRGIFVYGADKKGIPYYLADAELPNPDHEKEFAAMLYAGNSDYEAGFPVAYVSSLVNDQEYDDKRRKSMPSQPKKTVHVDQDYAVVRYH